MVDQPVIKISTSRISSDPVGFSNVARLHRDLSNLSRTKVILDFSRLAWIDGHLAASLHAIFLHARARSISFQYEGLSAAVAATLKKNSFLLPKQIDTYNTSIPLTEFDLNSAVPFSLFAKTHLQRKEMPSMSPALKGKFFEGVDELFANSALHSKSSLPITVCGQFFPKNRLLDFAIVDGGRGIAGSVASIGRRFSDEASAIDWAMQPGNTTREGDIPGGLGSEILREFIALNGGRLIIASGAGFWCQNGRNVTKSPLRYAFPGTTVILEINTSDKNKYDLAAPPDPTNIW
jgi:hypothetical protein